MKTPYPYQKYGADFLFLKKKGILADEMGIGKTLQAILASLRVKLPTLVICPASIKVNWAREILDEDPEAQIQIVDPGEQITDFATGNNTKWLIMNYDLLSKYGVDGLRMLLPYKVLIIDEAHNIKETKTIRTKASLQVGKYADYIFLLTGTPILNRPMELYPLLKIMDHPITKTKYGKDNWYGYAFRYCGGYFQEIKRWKTLPSGSRILETRRFMNVRGASRLDELRDRITDVYLRRTKAEVLKELPPKKVNIVKTKLEEPHAKLYAEAWQRYLDYLDKIKEELIIQLGSEEAYEEKRSNIEASQHLVELQKLQQVTSAAKIRRVTADAFKAAKQGEKVLIFTTYTKTLDTIKKILTFNKLKVVTLNGQTKNENRVKAVDALQEDEDTKIFIGNIKAAGVGITLNAAHRVFFIDSEWTPALNEQAEDRAHRIGQKYNVTIDYYVIEDTVDEDKQDALQAKRRIINNILGEGITNTRQEQSIVKEVLKKSLERAKSFPQKTLDKG